MKRCDGAEYGRIVILNGAPRAGKSSIAMEIQDTFDGVWINLGVDGYKAMIPKRFQPGIGLRPGGEGPDLEPVVVSLYTALYESVAVHSRMGIHVVADVGHHDSYSTPLKILPRCASILRDLPVLFVGVRCPIGEIMRRRENTSYLSYREDGTIPAPILLWQDAVHSPGIYDMEVDTSTDTPREIAKAIRERLDRAHFSAFRRLADQYGS